MRPALEEVEVEAEVDDEDECDEEMEGRVERRRWGEDDISVSTNCITRKY